MLYCPFSDGAPIKVKGHGQVARAPSECAVNSNITHATKHA